MEKQSEVHMSLRLPLQPFDRFVISSAYNVTVMCFILREISFRLQGNRHLLIDKGDELTVSHGPFTSYAKLWVVHAPWIPEAFSPPPRISDPDMHHGTSMTHVPWCMPGSLTSGFLLIRWWEKRSRHSRRMHSPQYCVSGKRPMIKYLWREQQRSSEAIQVSHPARSDLSWQARSLSIGRGPHIKGLKYLFTVFEHRFRVILSTIYTWKQHKQPMGFTKWLYHFMIHHKK